MKYPSKSPWVQNLCFVEVCDRMLEVVPLAYMLARLVNFFFLFIFCKQVFLVILASEMTGTFLQCPCRNAGDAAAGPWPALVRACGSEECGKGTDGAGGGGQWETRVLQKLRFTHADAEIRLSFVRTRSLA